MKRILSLMLVLAMLIPTMAFAERNDDLGYDYGLNVTFHSDEPMTYSIMFSDQENYPFQEDWLLWQAIEERTNVNITDEMTLIARVDYEDKKSLLVNSGDAPYIIPKTYEEGKFVAGGEILPISEWIQYMPNFMDKYEKWGMATDLMGMYQSDGKFYRLPGMKEVADGGYSYIIRKDVFEAAGVDMTQEVNWTYEDFYEAMKKVKEYTGADYVFSDRFKGESTLNIAAVMYDVSAGWGKANGMRFDWDTLDWYFGENTDKMKDFVTYFHKLVAEGIMDPESFTQEDDVALSKFYNGKSYVINGNYQNLADMISKMQVEGAELYLLTTPGGPAGMLQIESGRTECGTMISRNALDELGEEEFIKMLRFVDWLWYSDEGQELCRWGVEGVTYTKDENGVRHLNENIYYNGINPQVLESENPVQLNVDYGFSGGNFMYNDGSAELIFSMKPALQADWANRQSNYRTPRKIAPPIMGNPEQSDEMNLISTPLMDYVATSILNFITGAVDIEAGWDTFVQECENKGCYTYEDMCNEIWQDTRHIVGY